MAQPPAYNRTKDFGADYPDQTDNQAINTELDAVASSINGIRTNLAKIQRDDGGLRDGIVTKDSLAPELKDELYDEFSASINDSVLQAQQAASEAANAAEAAQGDADAAVAARQAAQAAASAAQASASSASASQSAAFASASAASSSANSASTSASAAGTSASGAESSRAAAESARDAAIQAKDAAVPAAQTATTKAGEAASSAAAAAASESLAQQWAIKTDGPVEGVEFSAKHWAEIAAQGAGLPVFPPTGIPTTDEGPIFVPGQGPMAWDGTRYVVTNGEHGKCRFEYVSATECRLMPCDGNGLVINGRQYRIPTAGIALTPGGVTTAQTHYVYAKDDGAGGIALERLLASSNPHSRHTDGVEIKTGDPTRSLVGMFWLDGSGNFLSSSTFDFVATWFNRTDRMVTNTVSNSTSASVDAPLTGNIGLLTWGSSLLSGEYLGRVSNTAIAFSSANIHVGGTTAPGMSVINRTSGDTSMILSLNRVKSISDGPMYSDVWGAVSAGTGTYSGNYRLMGRA